MSDKIVNKVANSSLITIDLADYIPKGTRKIIQLSDWLFEGIILKEVDFRNKIEHHNWEQYLNTFVVIKLASEAIVPIWAYLLLTSKLLPFAKKILVGTSQELENTLLLETINNTDFSEFKNLPIIIKGCSKITISENNYTQLIQKLQPIAKSLMFGEACSNVPLFKKKI